MEELAKGPRSSRTLAYDALRHSLLPSDDDLLVLFRDLIELVSMGQLSWEAFCVVARDSVKSRLGGPKDDHPECPYCEQALPQKIPSGLTSLGEVMGRLVPPSS